MQFIDIRSDTVTEPTQQMRDAILNAEYGDWAYGEDPIIHQLEKRVAEMLGKEDAAYVISGTFANQSTMNAVGNPGEEVLVAEKSHVFRYENGSLALWSRLMARTIPSDKNGFITPEQLRKFIRKIKDVQAPKTSILSLQNPTTEGRIYPPEQIKQLVSIAKKEGLHVHLDGARLFHATIVQKVDVKEFVKDFDTVMFCLSKGLGSPIGSIVVGKKDVIEKIRVIRKRLGGIVRKPGFFVKSCLISLDNIENFVGKANDSAQKLANELRKLQWIELTNDVDINMVFFKFVDPQTNKNIHKMDLEELKKFLYSHKVKTFLSSNYKDVNRFVTHHFVGDEEIQKVVSLLKEFYEKSAPQENKAE